ncbi:MBL fold metallo-hydrolase [Candidatus Uabimicrobium amorphum]|uniref:MBL fold metallo-hydrolase n=1 Tax=Uabimicrobium amorphum TaxID=2596890 RepID=A0A5S9ISA2_UABAM|nr:MBL fold metallo-hydrolase [Candidatus Uabimicrobium amorphum]BBM86686.1 MBL fold metallo-hydrolase [Candidatus Uabimicrobium amorphum]
MCKSTKNNKYIHQLFLICALLYISCSGAIDTRKYHRDTFTQATTSATTDVSIAFIHTGNTFSSESMIFDGGRTFCSHETVFVAVLVKHPQGTFLFDTGLGENIDEQFADNCCFHQMILSYNKTQAASTQLASHDMDIKMIIPSHLHWDHASGIVDFPHAQVWIQKNELLWAKSMFPPHVLPKQIHPRTINWKLFSFQDIPYENFTRSLDIFDDGSVILVPLEGHSPGSVGMFVNFPSGRRMFFSGDTTWAIEGVEIPTQKAWLVRCLVKPDHDEEQTRNMIVKLHWLSKKYPHLEIIPAHDGKVYKKYSSFPKFISK